MWGIDSLNDYYQISFNVETDNSEKITNRIYELTTKGIKNLSILLTGWGDVILDCKKLSSSNDVKILFLKWNSKGSIAFQKIEADGVDGNSGGGKTFYLTTFGRSIEIFYTYNLTPYIIGGYNYTL